MSTEDTRKKRECPKEDADQQETASQEEKVKKFRALHNPPAVAQPEHSEEKNGSPSLPYTVPKTSSKSRSLDLETALHCLVGKEDDGREYLLGDQYVRFRIGHSADALAIARWKRQREDQAKYTADSESTNKLDLKTGEDEDSSTSLELWLADGLGEEDGKPPSVFSLLGYVQPSAQLAAVALLTMAWENNERTLRVEWCDVDSSLGVAVLLKRRLMLRLSALALMTACRMLVVRGPGFREDLQN